MKRKKLQSVESKPNFAKQEHKWLKYWHEKGIVNQYLHKNDKSKKYFSFLDGPITANNPMGVHHAWGRTYKDIFQRYKNMQGFKQRFQNGFDCQGLWVEVEVEKEKGFKTKKDIESYGIDKFVKDCKRRIKKYSQIQTNQSERLGYFMDWDHSYYTMSEENNYMIWHFLKKCWQDGLIYKGEDSVPWCPRCGTAISQHEMDAEGYKQITHEAIFMRFPVIKNGKLLKNEFLLVWTTTPWTIPADTLVAVHPEINYALVESGNKKYWLAKSLVSKIFAHHYNILKSINGNDLIAKEKITHYQAPFDKLPIIKKVAQSPHFHQIVLAKDLVNEEEGTGLVHIVPGAGTEDYQLVKKELQWNEVIFPVIDEAGNYVQGYGNLSRKNAKKHPEIIIDYLKKSQYLLKTEKYTHSYPTCWRCKTELIWRLVEEWYISMDKKDKNGQSLREKMIAASKKIHWIPDFGRKRELDWLQNMHDWLISKKRYWGLALPIWECPKCGYFEVVGGKEELEKKAIKGWEKFKNHTPHRPWVDEVKIRCPKCGATMNRIRDVGNPWLDAGIVSFSTLLDPKTGKVSYLTDKKYWQKWYPADLILECFPGQFRNWFYSLIAMATELDNSPPTKTIFGHALVYDEKGEEMHKSKGNTIWFDEAAEKMGVDVMRWMYAQQNPEINLNFGYQAADKVRRQFHLLLWNTYRFFIAYYGLFGKINSKVIPSQNILDRWIISCLNQLIQKITQSLDNYNIQKASLAIQGFTENLSLWYVRRSRNRVAPHNQNTKDRDACLTTLKEVFTILSKLSAPFVPFLSEEIYQNLSGGKQSVHLENWPKSNQLLINKEVEEKMILIREICALGHAARKKAGIKVRQPLKKFKVQSSKFKVNKEFTNLIKEELNVKEVVFERGRGEIKVKLDIKITPKLRAEGEAREIIRKIQSARKKTQLSPQQLISVYLPNWPKEYEKEIKKRAGVSIIKNGKKFKIISNNVAI